MFSSPVIICQGALCSKNVFEEKGETVCGVLMHKIAFQADNRFVEGVCAQIALVLLGGFHHPGLVLCNGVFQELFQPSLL